MLKGILIFIVLWLIVSMGIITWRVMSGKEKLALFKVLLFGAVTAFLTIGILSVIVILF